MDLQSNIFDAVSSGNLQSLINLLKPLTESEIKDLVSSKLDGTTLVLIASRNGLCDILEYLVIQCGADVEQVGKVEFDGEKIDNAPPLWCAAAVGCLRCVSLLIDRGAHVNSTTSTNSTPLRAACFDGHFQIVKYLVRQGADIEIANQHGHTCLMISCYKRHFNIASYLIEKGANINRRSVKGNTALHDCTESNSMEIMKMLVRNGAHFLKDSYGLTPLITAALTGNKEMVEYLKSIYKCSIEDEVNAYKLLGATYVDKFYDLSGAFEFWRYALQKSAQCNQQYHQSLTNTNKYHTEAYAGAKEYQSEEDLSELYCDPDKMKMQSLIIRERILGIHHPETYYFIRYRGAAYADSGDYTRCLSLWMYNLERQQTQYKPLSEMTQNSFISIIELFSLMFSKCDSSVQICDIFRVLKLAIGELLSSSSITPVCKKNAIYQPLERKLVPRKDSRSFNVDNNGLDRHFLIVIMLVGFMCELRPQMSEKQWKSFKTSLYEFLSFEPRSASSYTILHVMSMITQQDLFTNLSIPLYDVFTVLVDVSRNLDIIDLSGNTPLHLLLKQPNINMDMVSYLLNAGAHLDCRNEEGLTPLDLAPLNSTNFTNQSCFKVKYLSLQCLCAQSIVKHKIPYGDLSENVHDFIRIHQNKGFSANVYQS